MPETIDPLRELDPLVAKLCPPQPHHGGDDVATPISSAPESSPRPGDPDPGPPAAEPAQRERARRDRVSAGAASIIPRAIDV
ncbi:hypothetical protein [Pseudonocardia parietis]|uniref:Uncharacterized protein n=1 Tax=Pseudonocardia parietis TaxID=570936 RepID=A0ABS4W6U6_9PSEU|nr:hypothetical protein [Pseudonocardia parietis]MBP2371932.1 hypothetical protein [Pseudonocardia parietis]